MANKEGEKIEKSIGTPTRPDVGSAPNKKPDKDNKK
jgi:hypothetical protein